MNNQYKRQLEPHNLNITIRKATEEDFAAILSLVKELAVFQHSPEKVTNSSEQMRKEKNLFNCFVAENEQREIVGIASYFLPIIHGLANHFTWMICM